MKSLSRLPAGRVGVIGNVLAFAGGVAFLQMQSGLPSLGVLAALTGLSWMGLLPRLRRLFFVAPLCFALFGFCWAGWAAQLRLADSLPQEWEMRDIELTGVVVALPQRFEHGERFVFDVETVHTAAARVPGRIMLSWYRGREEKEAMDDAGEAPAGRIVPGERWRFTVRLKRPHGNANPHGFDYEAWLLERNIRATGTIRAKAGVWRLAESVWRADTFVERLREKIRQRFLMAQPEAPGLGVLMALAIGDQRAIPAAQWQVFNRTGVTHLVSISGLHVTMVAALFATLVNFIWRRSERLMLFLPAQKAALLAAWLAAFGYALLAGFEVPAQRTLYMLSAVALAILSGRNFGVFRVLALALVTVLLLDPWAVLSAGFWLSFGAVGILLFVGSANLSSSGSGWRFALMRWGLSQWAVTLGSLPLLLLFFQQFSLVSPLANALAIPWVSFVITPLALLYSVVPWTPLLALNHALFLPLLNGLEWLSTFPVWQQVAPPLWASLMAVTGVLWMLLPRGFPARRAGLFLLLPALFLPAPRPASGQAWVDILDVGQGLAVVVRTAGHTLLYDTGPMYSAQANAGQRVVVPFLRAAGVTRLDTLIVSHRDKDHAGGLPAVQENLTVARLLSSMDEAGHERCMAGQTWRWDGVDFSILHPMPDDYGKPARKPNNVSCVLRIESSGSSLLLTGDIEAADEKALVSRERALKSDGLVAPHHGGMGSSTPDFLSAVGAREAIFSAGYRNAFRHPRPEIIDRYGGSRIWRTDRQGAIHLALNDVLRVSAWRAERKRYWSGQ